MAGSVVAAAAESAEDVAAMRLEEIPIAPMRQPRRSGGAGAAKYAARSEPGRRVVAVRMRREARIGLEGARGPLPCVTPAEAGQGDRRALPFRLRRQAAAGPAAPGFRFLGTHVHH